jgi:hypothetical protein
VCQVRLAMTASHSFSGGTAEPVQQDGGGDAIRRQLWDGRT